MGHFTSFFYIMSLSSGVHFILIAHVHSDARISSEILDQYLGLINFIVVKSKFTSPSCSKNTSKFSNSFLSPWMCFLSFSTPPCWQAILVFKIKCKLIKFLNIENSAPRCHQSHVKYSEASPGQCTALDSAGLSAPEK